jgi:three-Cys-motif partner protein
MAIRMTDTRKQPRARIMTAGKRKKNDNRYPLDPPIPPDPDLSLPIERGPKEEGVGNWVPEEKHRLLWEYLDASRYAWRRWQSRIFIDPFSGPGRLQVKGESFTRPGGAVFAHLALTRDAPFTNIFVGDLDAARAVACERRLKAVGATAKAFPGSAATTVNEMVAAVPRGSLCMAYLDPYNLEHLLFAILRTLSGLPKIDLAINFSTMDLQRNVELEFDPQRDRFDGAAPGWRRNPAICSASRQNAKLEFFRYWLNLVQGLGFKHSAQMPTIQNTSGHGIYRLCFFSRHSFPDRIWNDVARSPNRQLFDD